MYKALTTLLSIILLLSITTASAAVPSVMNYQGRLTDASGNPLDTTVSMVFTIYDNSVGSNSKWSETQPSVTVTGGLFTVLLGSVNPIDDTVFSSNQRWLGITVGGDPEIAPRSRLASSPWTFESASPWVKKQGNSDYIAPADNELPVYIGTDPAMVLPTLLWVECDETGATDQFPVVFLSDGHSLVNNTRTLYTVARGATNENIAVDALAYGGASSWAGRFASRVGIFAYNSDSDTLVVLDSTSYGSGAVTTWGPGGSRNVRMSHLVDHPENGYVAVLNDANEGRAGMYVDADGCGAMYTIGPDGSNNVVIDANGSPDWGRIGVCDQYGTMQSSLQISGISGYGIIYSDRLYLSENSFADASVDIPDSSINRDEILDEPGLARGVLGGAVTLTGTSAMTDIVTVTVTIPSDGYILLTGQTYVKLWNTLNVNGVYIQIDEEAEGTSESPNYARLSLAATPTTNNQRFPVYVDRVYQKAAGTYEFRLEGMMDPAATGDAEVAQSSITAVYLPTSYGAVSTLTQSPDDYPQALPVTVGEADESRQTAYQVDLRHLELRAKEARMAALQAERDLLNAQMQVQTAAEQQ